VLELDNEAVDLVKLASGRRSFPPSGHPRGDMQEKVAGGDINARRKKPVRWPRRCLMSCLACPTAAPPPSCLCFRVTTRLRHR